MFPAVRLSRLRRFAKLRSLVSEIDVDIDDLVYPIFVKEGAARPEPIESMPGQFRLPIDKVVYEVEKASQLGIPATILFGIPLKKDETGSPAYDSEGVVQRAVRSLKERLGDNIVVMTDVCLCQYTTHGHCGALKEGRLDHDATLGILRKMAVSHAEAGSDIVAPSGMIDGQVKAIREALDDAGFKDVAIMAYSAKHASCFYGPFREAAHSAPAFGDRRSYQMDFRNPNEALREVELDLKEGADIVMVKPALAYLDIIYRVKHEFGTPTAAYNVSGEYAAIKAAAQKGWINERDAVLEVLTAIKRAGADMILTYFAKDFARWKREV